MNEELEAQELIGRRFREFLASDVGKYLSGCTEQDIDAAKDELLELNPYSFDSLVDLQNKISQIKRRAEIASALIEYIQEAIVQGNQALHQLENEGSD